MEAIAAFGAAVNIIQLVDFTSKLVSGGTELYRSADGELLEHSELQKITASLSALTQNVNESLLSLKQDRQLTQQELEQVRLGNECTRVASELLEALESLKVGGKPGKWRAVRQALLTVWHKDKIDALERRLDRFRQELIADILGPSGMEPFFLRVAFQVSSDPSNRLRVQLINEKQSSVLSKVENIEHATEKIGLTFLGHIDNSNRWRNDLIEAIHSNAGQSRRSRNILKPPVGESGATGNEHDERLSIVLIDHLRFGDMLDREMRIPDAHKMTFEWIYKDPCANDKPWTSFIDWLEKQEKGLYWITGKAGSGKSTLMKYLYNNARTIALLENWASPSKLITTAFFFWNSGSNMQMSMMGLLRSLLFQVLKLVPSWVALVFPERWEVYTLFGEDSYPWSWQELANALKLLVLEMKPDTKFCFFIDGLDEFDGNPSDLTDLLLDLVALAPNLKICTASRPWANFEDAFKGRPNLLLQDLTYPDIQAYVDTKFHANAGFVELQEREPEYARELLTQVALKAEGVFLWVYLVVQSLLTGLTNGDRVSDLQRRLDQLPPRLEDLFRKILDNLDPFYLEHASQLFQLARASRVSPTLLCLSLADEEDPEYCFRTAVKPFTNSEKFSRSRNMKRRLNSRCKGLLGVDSQLSENMANQKVQYLHRTVKDFLEAPAVWSWIVGSTSKPFDPHLSLCRSFLLQLKGLDATSLQIDSFWSIIIWCIEHAATAKVENRNVSIRLLDQLDQSIGKLTTQQYRNFQAVLETFGGHVDGSKLHWTISLLNWKTGTSFLYLATMCDLNWYLERKLTPVYFELLPNEKPRILRAALSDYMFLTRYHDMPFCSRGSPRTETTRTLLLNMKLVGGNGKDWAEVKDLLEKHGLGDILESFPTAQSLPSSRPLTGSHADFADPCTPSSVSEPPRSGVGSSGEAKRSREPKRTYSLKERPRMLYRRFLDRCNRNRHPMNLEAIKEEGKRADKEVKEESETPTSLFSLLAETNERARSTDSLEVLVGGQ